MKNIKLAIGLPHYQGISNFHQASMWLELGAALADSRERFTLVTRMLANVCGVDKARNLCMENAREHKADWLLMIDADTWVSDGGDLLQMISDAEKLNASIVGAAVPRRTLTNERTFMAYDCPAEGEAVSLTEAALRRGTLDGGELRRGNTSDWSSFTPVDAMATACIAINMRHAELLDRPFFRFSRGESEDLDFCRRMREWRGGMMRVDADGWLSAGEASTEVSIPGRVLIDKRVSAFHLNHPAILKGL